MTARKKRIAANYQIQATVSIIRKSMQTTVRQVPMFMISGDVATREDAIARGAAAIIACADLTSGDLYAVTLTVTEPNGTCYALDTLYFGGEKVKVGL